MNTDMLLLICDIIVIHSFCRLGTESIFSIFLAKVKGTSHVQSMWFHDCCEMKKNHFTIYCQFQSSLNTCIYIYIYIYIFFFLDKMSSILA